MQTQAWKAHKPRCKEMVAALAARIAASNLLVRTASRVSEPMMGSAFRRYLGSVTQYNTTLESRLQAYLVAAPPAGLFVRGTPLAHIIIHNHFSFDPTSKAFHLESARVVDIKDLEEWYGADGGSAMPWSEHADAFKQQSEHPPRLCDNGIRLPRASIFYTCTAIDAPEAARTTACQVGCVDFGGYSFSGFDPDSVGLDWETPFKAHINSGFDSKEAFRALVFYVARDLARANPGWVSNAHAFWDHKLCQAYKNETEVGATAFFPAGEEWDVKCVAYATPRELSSLQPHLLDQGWVTPGALREAEGKVKQRDMGGGKVAFVEEGGAQYTLQRRADGRTERTNIKGTGVQTIVFEPGYDPDNLPEGIRLEYIPAPAQ
ncbi:hypothetical protein RQP46_005964 [Phenoliferia psychrophenolica]